MKKCAHSLQSFRAGCNYHRHLIIPASGSFRKDWLPVRVLLILTVVAAVFIFLFDVYQVIY
ncbi:MAG: hypothetical protein ABI863_11350 [Ginsengibacter sp.]